MRAGRIARITGRVAVISLLGLGVSVAGGQAAFADEFVWDSAPAGSDGSSAVSDEFVWDSAGVGAISADEFVWD